MPARINLIARDNGVGLSRDLRLLAAVLEGSGCEVTLTGIRRGKLTKWFRPWQLRLGWAWRRLTRGARAHTHDLNLMLEHIWPDDAPFARVNALIPNPEWLLPRDRRRLGRVDHVLAKTRHAQALFEALERPVHFIGFTSLDRQLPEVPRVHEFFHLAGRSSAKGTERLLALWRRHPEWPRLTVVQSPLRAQPGAPAANIDHRVGYLDDHELRVLQNRHRFHLCPSETEGYGHYLVEAMSVGAVAVTLDAPPMNELVRPDRGLLVPPAASTGQQHLATTFHFDDAAMEQAIATLLAMDDATTASLGGAARAWFEDNTRDFGARLPAVIAALI